MAVEVLFASTALNDVSTKKAIYKQLGVPSYWVIDPDEPWLRIFELNPDGQYQQVAEVTGRERFEAERPFPVRIVPADLLGRLAP